MEVRNNERLATLRARLLTACLARFLADGEFATVALFAIALFAIE